jgi:hypothetical protein
MDQPEELDGLSEPVGNTEHREVECNKVDNASDSSAINLVTVPD